MLLAGQPSFRFEACHPSCVASSRRARRWKAGRSRTTCFAPGGQAAHPRRNQATAGWTCARLGATCPRRYRQGGEEEPLIVDVDASAVLEPAVDTRPPSLGLCPLTFHTEYFHPVHRASSSPTSRMRFCRFESCTIVRKGWAEFRASSCNSRASIKTGKTDGACFGRPESHVDSAEPPGAGKRPLGSAPAVSGAGDVRPPQARKSLKRDTTYLLVVSPPSAVTKPTGRRRRPNRRSTALSRRPSP